MVTEPDDVKVQPTVLQLLEEVLNGMDCMQKLETTCEGHTSAGEGQGRAVEPLTVKVDLGIGDAVEHEGITVDGEQLLACEIANKID